MEIDSVLLVNILTLIVLAMSAFVAILQLRSLKRQMRSQHEWNRREAGIQYTFERDPTFKQTRYKLETTLRLTTRKPGEISLEEILKHQKSYPNTVTDIQIVLGRYELMAIGIKHQVCDEAICKDVLRGALIRYYRTFCQYIEDVRKTQNNPHLYENLEYYAKRWSMQEVKQRKPTG